MSRRLLDTDTAVALRNGLPIVTGNVAHFEHVRSVGYHVIIENWRGG